MLARVVEAAKQSSMDDAKKVQQEVVAEAGVVRHYMGTYLLPQALDEARGEQRLRNASEEQVAIHILRGRR